MAATKSSRTGADHVRGIALPARWRLPSVLPEIDEGGKNRKSPRATESSAQEGTPARLDVDRSGSVAVITELTPARIARMRGIRVSVTLHPGDSLCFIGSANGSKGNQKPYSSRQPPANPADITCGMRTWFAPPPGIPKSTQMYEMGAEPAPGPGSPAWPAPAGRHNGPHRSVSTPATGAGWCSSRAGLTVRAGRGARPGLLSAPDGFRFHDLRHRPHLATARAPSRTAAAGVVRLVPIEHGRGAGADEPVFVRADQRPGD